MAYKPDSAVTTIVVHYSATPIERDYTAADIDTMHRARGFNEIGYHYFIRKDGTVETGRDLSEPGRFEVGAHSKGENSSSIGICYEGGVRASNVNVGFDSRTREQTVAMTALIISLLERFPGAVVKGHRDMPGAATQCPGFDATEWWDKQSAAMVAEANAVRDVSKRRDHPAQSTTVQASTAQMAAGAGGAWAAVSQLDGTAQYIALGVCGAVVLLGMWICRERLKKWAAGVR